MGDNGGDRAAEIDEEEQAEEADNVAMEVIRQALLETTLAIGRIGCVIHIFANACTFAKLSQGNHTVQELEFIVHANSYRDYKRLRVLEKGFDNLEALRVLTIRSRFHGDAEEEEDDGVERDVAESFYWEAFACALGRVRHPIEVRLDDFCYDYNYFSKFWVAIQGVSTIRTFHSGVVPMKDANTLMSALATLPSLENVTLGDFTDQSGGCEYQGLTNLLKSPSMRSIEFSGMFFSIDISWALQAALEEGSFVTDLRFSECYSWYESLDEGFRDHQTAAILGLVRALQRNSSVKTLSLIGNDFRELLSSLLASVLLVNTTLVDITLRTERSGLYWHLSGQQQEGGRWLQPLFVAMRINTSLKSLDVSDFHLTDKLVCESLRDMLAKNSALESLTLHSPECLDDTSVVSWRTILPFIRGNESVKSLTIAFTGDALDPHVATLCFDTVAMLEGNTTLECLDIKSSGISPDAYFAALESLKPRSTLTTLRLSPVLASMGIEKMNEVVFLVKKNYSLEVLDGNVSADDKSGELGSLLRLNKAGRHYLIEDAASIANGVEVLIGVSDDLGCLFYHLLENPTLCDIEHQYNTKSGAHSNKRQRIQSRGNENSPQNTR